MKTIQRIIILGLMVLSGPGWAGTLNLTIEDADSGEPIYCRIRATQGASWLRPTNEVEVYGGQGNTQTVGRLRSGRDYSFVHGVADFTALSGTVNVLIEKGFEYLPYDQDITVPASGVTNITIALQQFTNMNAAGWYNGDPHVHHIIKNDTNLMALETRLLQAEGMNVLMGMNQYTPNTEILVQQSERLGEAAAIVDGDVQFTGIEELRQEQYGHIGLYLITNYIYHAGHSYWPINPEYAYQTYLQGGYLTECHAGAACCGLMGLYANNAFGLNDGIEILQYRTLNLDAWYRTLNNNIINAPVGGTDVPVGGGIEGEERTYVYVEGSLTLRKWMEGLAAGRSFVSGGPLLDFQVNGTNMGSHVRLAAATGGVVQVEAWAESRFPCDRLELVHNGSVIDTNYFSGSRRVDFSSSISITSSCWLAVRVYGTNSTDGANQQAHSSPIYVYVNDRPVEVDQTWQGAAWAKNNIASQKNFYMALTNLPDEVYMKAYYSNIFDTASAYYTRLRRIEEGKFSPPTIIAPYPSAYFEEIAQPAVPVSFGFSGHIVVESGPHMTIQVNTNAPFSYYGRSPYTVTGLVSGVHTVTLQLVDHTGAALTNSESVVEKVFTVAAGVGIDDPQIGRSPVSVRRYGVQMGAVSNAMIQIWNAGTGTVNYTVSTNAGWMTLSAVSGVTTGEVDAVTVNFNTAGLSPGVHTGLVSISSAEAVNSPQTTAITLTLEPAPLPGIQLSDSQFSRTAGQGSSPAGHSFTLANGGTGTITYTVATNVSWLAVSPVSGVSTGEADTVNITYASAGLAGGVYTGEVSVSAPEATNSPQILQVILTVDAVAPSLSSAAILNDTQVRAVFSEDLDPVTATNTAIYSITNGHTVSGATLAGDQVSVTLDVATLSPGWYGLEINGAKDVYGNTSGLLATSLYYSGSAPAADTNWQAYDGFELFTTGMALVGQGSTTNGWSGGWDNGSGPGITVETVPGGPLTYSRGSVLVEGGSRAAAVSSGAGTLARGLAAPRGYTNVSYISFLVKHTGTPTSSELLAIIPLDSIYAYEVQYGMRENGGNYSLYHRYPNSPNTLGSLTNDDTYFMVIRMDGSGSAWTNSTVYINPTSAVVESGMMIDSQSGSQTRDSGLNGLGFRPSGVGAGTYYLDEIRIGESWQSVVPAAPAAGGPGGDTDADGLPDSWELTYFGGPTNADSGADSDLDGMSNLGEYLAGTNPTNIASYFAIDSSSAFSGAGNIIFWQAVTGRSYSLQWATNLNTFSLLQSNVTVPASGMIGITDALHQAEDRIYYRLRSRLD